MAAGNAPAGPPGGHGPVDPARRGLRAAVLLCAALVPLLVVVVLVVGGDRRATAPELPERLLGLPAQRSSAARDVATDLADRLAAEPSVSSVSVGVYGAREQTLVVLRLVPHGPLSDAVAADLADRVLGATAPSGGNEDVTAGSADGRARITCARPPSAALTCVSVEREAALVVLGTGTGTDPVAVTEQVRDELRVGEDASG